MCGTEDKEKVISVLRIVSPVLSSWSTRGDLDGRGGREGTQEVEGGTRGQAQGAGGAQGTHVIPSHLHEQRLHEARGPARGLMGLQGVDWGHLS